MNVLVNYDLYKRVIAIMLDNASAINVIIELMLLNLSGFHEELFYITCAYHIINLKVKDRLDLVLESIQK